jgi:hypothetical protein
MIRQIATFFNLRNLSLGTLLVAMTMSTGCRQRLSTPAPDDSAYYPLQVGSYWLYQVTTEQYLAANSTLKQVYQIQEKISSSYNLNGQLVYLVEESRRQTSESAWKLQAIHTVYKSLSEVVDQENNVPIVKLVFPVAATPFWNASLYNANPITLLQYQQVGRSFSVGKRTFDDTISVVGTNDSTLVKQEKYFRVYARAIGCVYREDRSLAFCQSSPSCIGKSLIESGTISKWELITSDRLP